MGTASPDSRAGVVGIPSPRVHHLKAHICNESRTLFVSASGLENAKKLVSSYKEGQIKSITPEIWQAKKVVDSTLHPGMP